MALENFRKVLTNIGDILETAMWKEGHNCSCEVWEKLEKIFLELPKEEVDFLEEKMSLVAKAKILLPRQGVEAQHLPIGFLHFAFGMLYFNPNEFDHLAEK